VKVREKAMIRKVDLLTSKENPPTYKEMSKKLGISSPTIHKIIHQDLKKITHRKRVVHALKTSHKENKKTNTRKLCEGHLAGKKSEFIVTLDEALFYLADCNGERRICYTTKKKQVEELVVQKRERFGEKVMIVGAKSGPGTLPLIKAPQNVKINANYYIEKILKPLLETHVPKLYPGETSKVYVHHDAATSHTARLTRDYAKDLHDRLGITIINNKDIPVKSPDASPMDFFEFGFLKQKLFL
jgi:hypothetical protein